MQPPKKTPRRAGGLARGSDGDIKRFECLLDIKQADPLQERPETPAGIHLCRRFAIRPVIADLVATLAGLGPDRRAA